MGLVNYLLRLGVSKNAGTRQEDLARGGRHEKGEEEEDSVMPRGCARVPDGSGEVARNGLGIGWVLGNRGVKNFDFTSHATFSKSKSYSSGVRKTPFRCIYAQHHDH